MITDVCGRLHVDGVLYSRGDMLVEYTSMCVCRRVAGCCLRRQTPLRRRSLVRFASWDAHGHQPGDAQGHQPRDAQGHQPVDAQGHQPRDAQGHQPLTAASPSRGHVPVMVNEVIRLMRPRPGKVFLDMTFGGGGHTKALLADCPDITVYALDRDPLAHDMANQLAKTTPSVVPLLGKFSTVARLLTPHGLGPSSLDGVLLDVGASSCQFDSPGRGFSLAKDGPLDMRMDRGREDSLTAEDVVNQLDESDLYKIFKKYGEEKNGRRVAQAIVARRYAFGRIRTTHQLANTVASAFDDSHSRSDKLHRPSHVATKVFQALRIFVNDELNELSNGLSLAGRLLKPGGICVAISFHSLEDRIVKRHFHGTDMDARVNMSVGDHHRVGRATHDRRDMDRVLEKVWEVGTSRGLVLPTEEEVAGNPRARSAKLRSARRRRETITTAVAAAAASSGLLRE